MKSWIAYGVNGYGIHVIHNTISMIVGSISDYMFEGCVDRSDANRVQVVSTSSVTQLR